MVAPDWLKVAMARCSAPSSAAEMATFCAMSIYGTGDACAGSAALRSRLGT